MTSKRVVLLLCACVAIQASKLHRAAIKGLADEVAALLDSGLGINDIEDMVPSALGSTPLHLAVKEKHVNVVKLLIARGADLDATSDEGFTALEVALFSGAFDIAKLLWKGGADPNLVPDKRPVTMLQSAASHAHARNVVIARWLLSHGALVDKQGHNPSLRLHSAAPGSMERQRSDGKDSTGQRRFEGVGNVQGESRRTQRHQSSASDRRRKGDGQAARHWRGSRSQACSSVVRASRRTLAIKFAKAACRPSLGPFR